MDLSSSKKDLSRKQGSATRSHSVAALVLRNGAGPPPVVARIKFSSTVSIAVRAEIQGAHVAEGESGLPEVCYEGVGASATYVSPHGPLVGDTHGSLIVGDFKLVPFCISRKTGTSFVGVTNRRRYTVLSAQPWDWRANGEKPEEGLAMDLELYGTALTVQVRSATIMELKRCLQLQALREAEEDGNYDALHAQVTKAKMAGVDLEHIERGEEQLKVLRKQGWHINPGCEKETLRELMQWAKITHRNDADVNLECLADPNCPCNERENPGEVLNFVPDAVQSILGKNTDKRLFEAMVDAAIGVEEGSVWRAGGKFIFSAFNRNQSVVALTRMLSNYGKKDCAKMLLKLAGDSEKKYGGYVTAVQVNFHPSGETYHDQHRDIYSAKQRAGPNCTCSFRECVGTVCYSLGSSRICHLETAVDDLSAVKACGNDCTGRREKKWLHSGVAMFFNGPWNQNHTHGIPKSEAEVGPRISIAFLLGAAG